MFSKPKVVISLMLAHDAGLREVARAMAKRIDRMLLNAYRKGRLDLHAKYGRHKRLMYTKILVWEGLFYRLTSLYIYIYMSVYPSVCLQPFLCAEISQNFNTSNFHQSFKRL